jgi:hypothetical protein
VDSIPETGELLFVDFSELEGNYASIEVKMGDKVLEVDSDVQFDGKKGKFILYARKGDESPAPSSNSPSPTKSPTSGPKPTPSPSSSKCTAPEEDLAKVSRADVLKLTIEYLDCIKIGGLNFIYGKRPFLKNYRVTGTAIEFMFEETANEADVVKVALRDTLLVDSVGIPIDRLKEPVWINPSEDAKRSVFADKKGSDDEDKSWEANDFYAISFEVTDLDSGSGATALYVLIAIITVVALIITVVLIVSLNKKKEDDYMPIDDLEDDRLLTDTY